MSFKRSRANASRKRPRSRERVTASRPAWIKQVTLIRGQPHGTDANCRRYRSCGIHRLSSRKLARIDRTVSVWRSLLMRMVYRIHRIAAHPAQLPFIAALRDKGLHGKFAHLELSPHAFRIRVQFRLTSDQSLQRTSVYRQPRDRAAPEPRSVRPSACQFFVLCCMFE